MLSNYINANHTDCDCILPYVTFAYNTAKQASTEFTPFFLLYGREARLPIDISLGTTRQTYYYDSDDYAVELREILKQSYHIAKHNIQRAQERQKQNYDRAA